jgi:uncharacterized protein YbjT (DUF2867 family)
LANLGIEIMMGDVGDRASLERAFAGQRVVFHTAGLVTDWQGNKLRRSSEGRTTG